MLFSVPAGTLVPPVLQCFFVPARCWYPRCYGVIFVPAVRWCLRGWWMDTVDDTSGDKISPGLRRPGDSLWFEKAGLISRLLSSCER